MGLERLIPLPNKREMQYGAFEQLLDKGIADALARVKERFEQAENALDNLEYHNVEHTENVIRRTRLILEAMQESRRLVKLGEYIAANHDTVQDYDVVEKDGAKIRQRRTEKNEGTSAKDAVEYLRETGGALVTPEDEKLVHDGICVTIPRYSQEHRTMTQPHLKPESDMVIRAVAFADLGTAGMDGLDAFVREGNALFREENIDIAEAFRHPEALTEEQKESFTQRMLAWSDAQPQFARGREKLLDDELEGLPEETRQAVRALFDKFYESIQGAQAKHDRRKGMSFEELARDFGYKL